MLIYRNEKAAVVAGALWGYRFVFHGTRLRLRPTAWMKRHKRQIDKLLAARGFDTHPSPRVEAAVWDHMIDLANSPLNGLHHQAVASMPIAQVVDEILNDAYANY